MFFSQLRYSFLVLNEELFDGVMPIKLSASQNNLVKKVENVVKKSVDRM